MIIASWKEEEDAAGGDRRGKAAERVRVSYSVN